MRIGYARRMVEMVTNQIMVQTAVLAQHLRGAHAARVLQSAAHRLRHRYAKCLPLRQVQCPICRRRSGYGKQASFGEPPKLTRGPRVLPMNP